MNDRLTIVAAQQTALHHACRLACETAHPRFSHVLHAGTINLVLSVNSGYE
jgi:hypothetical protein